MLSLTYNHSMRLNEAWTTPVTLPAARNGDAGRQLFSETTMALGRDYS